MTDNTKHSDKKDNFDMTESALDEVISEKQAEISFQIDQLKEVDT